MILSVFGDESADEKKQRVFAVGGLLGSEAEWEVAERQWLARTGGEEFHAADCEHEGNHELYRDLTQILARGPLAGVSVALDLASHRAVFKDPLDDVGYHKCLGDLLVLFARLAVRFNDTQAQDDPVKVQFTFDHRKQSERNAGTLYSLLINEPEWATADVLGSRISFDCRTNPRIQMADLFTREGMKEFDRKITNRSPKPRTSWQVLDATRKFQWVEYDRAYCEWLSGEIADIRLEMGVSAGGYQQWLLANGRVQNGVLPTGMGDRYRYFQSLTTSDGLSGQAKGTVGKVTK